MIHTVPRYLLVGIICALLHNAVMIGCDLIGIHYVVSSLISYVIVGITGFALHSGFTFRQPVSAGSFLRYAAGMAPNYPASIVLMYLLCDVAGQPVPVAAPLATVILVAWNYLISRWAIVRKATMGRAV